MSLIKEEMVSEIIILRRRRGGRIGYRWAKGGHYRDYRNSLGDWQYRDGACRETRNPTDAESGVIDGCAQTVDFGARMPTKRMNKYGRTIPSMRRISRQKKTDGIDCMRRNSPSGSIGSGGGGMPEEVGSICILDNSRGLRTKILRGMLSMSNYIE